LGISQSHDVREAVWKSDVSGTIEQASETFNYDAVYVDVSRDWLNKRRFIVLVRKQYPIVPFVLVGDRETFLSSCDAQDQARFGHYFFLETSLPLSRLPETIAETLSLIDYDISKRYGERTPL
jgi:hypothetical protein